MIFDMAFRSLTSILLLAFPMLFSIQVSAANYSNPLKARDGGDPNIVYSQGYYHLMSTNGRNLEMTRARTLEGLKRGEKRVLYSDDAPSRCCDLWAPEMHLVDGAWHIYYTAGPGDTKLQRGHVIRGGDSPWGDYEYLGQLRDDYSVDGTLLYIEGQRYYVYSGRDTDDTQSLFIAPMTSPSSTGERALLSRPSEDWESRNDFLNEGAYALYYNGRTFMTFSAGTCDNPNYQLGLLTYNGGDPMDMSNWSKTGPVFSAANGNFGTGHNSFFASPDGTETWNVWHSVTNPEGSCGGDRRVNARVVQWRTDGTPDFGQPPEPGAVLRGPSGEPEE